MPGEKADFVHSLHRALRFDVEPPDFIDLIVKEVQAEGLLRSHRKDVDDAAAHREFAGGEHLLDVGIAREDKVLLELFE